MVVTSLDEHLIKTGAKLLRQLDDDNVRVDAALWYYFTDSQGWKLVFSLPEIINQGPKAAYQVIQVALSKITDSPFSLKDVVIADSDSNLIKSLRLAISTGPGISGIRFSNNVINGQLIQDAYIYRLTRKSFAGTNPLKTH